MRLSYVSSGFQEKRERGSTGCRKRGGDEASLSSVGRNAETLRSCRVVCCTTGRPVLPPARPAVDRRQCRKTCNAARPAALHRQEKQPATRSERPDKRDVTLTSNNKKNTHHDLSPHLALFSLAVFGRFLLDLFAAAALALFAWLGCAIAPAVFEPAEAAREYIVYKKAFARGQGCPPSCRKGRPSSSSSPKRCARGTWLFALFGYLVSLLGYCYVPGTRQAPNGCLTFVD